MGSVNWQVLYAPDATGELLSSAEMVQEQLAMRAHRSGQLLRRLNP
jgi:hypothetical protein